MLLNKWQITEKIIRDVKKYSEQIYKENKTYQNLWNIDQKSLSGKFATLKNAFVRKKEKSEIKDVKF